MKTVAFECYADEDLVRFLTEACDLKLKLFHAFGQGEVINSVLVKGSCDIGVVDQDPDATHHHRRNDMKLVERTSNVELRRSGQRHILVIKPDLERCFLRSMGIAKLESKLPANFSELHAVLNIPGSRKHALFREELSVLHAASSRSNLPTMTTDLVRLFGAVV